MPQKFSTLISITAVLVLLLSACAPQATPDVSAISTIAAQTVEARFTALAAAFTATPLPATQTPIPPVPATDVPAADTATPAPPAPSGNGKACYAMTFISDVTIPDGMIIAPGAQFTKTWRVRNDGNCVWDQSYSLVLDKGDALGTVTSFPLPRVVNPGDSLDISIDLTAPSADGDYAGYWHVLTPYGGTMGVGTYNQSMIVKISVSAKPDRDFGVVSVVYGMERQPAKGCGSDGADYNFTATITVNGPGEINYSWEKSIDDGTHPGGKLKFAAAGTKTVTWTWRMTNGHIENIDRYVWIKTLVGSNATEFRDNGPVFNFTCSTP